MKNQFFYTVKQTIAPGAPGRANTEPIEVMQIASFNMEKVIRSLELSDGTLVIILDDFHVEQRQSVNNNANGKPIVKMEPVTVQSEIILSKEDKERFMRVTSVHEPITMNVEALPKMESIH
jgi:hypothetical protein